MSHQSVATIKVATVKVGTSQVRAGSLTASGSIPLPADCQPAPVGPPFQIGLTGTIAGGSLAAGATSVTGINASICGVVTLAQSTPPVAAQGCPATGIVTVPADGQVFAPLKAVLSLVPGQPISVPFAVVPSTLTGSLGCTLDTSNGLAITVNANVAGSTGLFGIACLVGPITIPLSGIAGAPGSGSIYTPSQLTLNGTFQASNFTVPAVTGNPRCPAGVAANLNPLAGLPIPAGSAHLVLPFSTSLYTSAG